jgi:hypothetical protein
MNRITHTSIAIILLLAILVLAACGDSNPLSHGNTRLICRDRVEYMMFWRTSSSGSVSISVVPHFKPDGSLYTCVEQPKAESK